MIALTVLMDEVDPARYTDETERMGETESEGEDETAKQRLRPLT
jgi:hypothetical protein